jgi:hypothetical protein
MTVTPLASLRPPLSELHTPLSVAPSNKPFLASRDEGGSHRIQERFRTCASSNLPQQESGLGLLAVAFSGSLVSDRDP